MKTEIIKNEKLKETCYFSQLDCGLKVYITPKSDFTSYYAVFGTKYGSIDTTFRLKGEEEFVTVPEGIAHFLEHKLFENEDCDAFERFAKTGAYSNAYTSFDRTCYLFSCTERFEENLDILLDFVSTPCFTEQSVQKEQGIIGQEIRMYDDEPSWRVYINLCECLYHNHPIKIDVAGTTESIAKITDKLLYKCYDVFYNPSNMFVAVAGPVDAEKTLEKINRFFKDRKKAEVERVMPNEPLDIVKDFNRQKMSVSQPLFNIGFKENPQNSTLEREVETCVLLEIISGKGSHLYNKMLKEGLINDTFSAYYSVGEGYAFEIFEGESQNPQKVKDEVINEINRLRTQGIDEQSFIRAKNSLYGKEVMVYNSVERIANSSVSYAIEDKPPFESIKAFERVTLEDVTKRLFAHFDETKCALSVVTPNAERG